MIFPVIMYGCESQTIKAEHLRSDAFKLVLEKTLESPLDSKEVNQSILKEINPEYWLEELLLKFQYFGHLMQRTYSLEKTLILGKIKGKRRGWLRVRLAVGHHWLNGHELEQTLGDSEGQRSLASCSSWGHRVRHQWLNNNKKRQAILFSSNFCLYSFILENNTSVNSYIQSNLGWNTNCIVTKPIFYPIISIILFWEVLCLSFLGIFHKMSIIIML